MTIIFVDEKNVQKYDMITQHASTKEICPVKAWLAIVVRILTYPNTGPRTDIDLFDTGDGSLGHIQAIDPAT